MIIEKVVAPENMSNKEPYGTRWIADLEAGQQIWIQISKDQEKPSWVRLGSLCEYYYGRNKNILEGCTIANAFITSIDETKKISKNDE